ncbi:unnamed protein product [Linum tenue]|uniref:Uncharacterized protein n=1 Tax=Linum tenue TaxID=586396 RepID=A0AAV0MYQ6_9ROSI|nr:unnamed protein product [Linum tenue]
MASLQKFKLLATQCGVAPSPTRSPRTSPVVHFRRRKTTLRMLLTRSSGRRNRDEPAPPPIYAAAPERRRGSLKDLFVSSPAAEEEEEGDGGRESTIDGGGGGGDRYQVWKMKVSELGGAAAAGWMGFRHRSILRRAWRPVLVGIPETAGDDDDESEKLRLLS